VVQRRQEQHAGIIYERAAKRGEQIDASAPAMYPTHVDKISEALMKEGSDHSAIVNITQLTTLYSGARPCEPENLALRGMQDDDDFNVTKGPLPQKKRRRRRSIPSRQRHTVTDLGTWLGATSMFSYFAKPWSAKEMSLAIWSPTLTGSSLNCNRWIIRASGQESNSSTSRRDLTGNHPRNC
jgi:hypothetical protein